MSLKRLTMKIVEEYANANKEAFILLQIPYMSPMQPYSMIPTHPPIPIRGKRLLGCPIPTKTEVLLPGEPCLGAFALRRLQGFHCGIPV